MKKSLYFIVLISIIFILPIASAEIFFSQPKALYNIGDEFNFTLTLAPNSDTNGFITVALLCSQGLPRDFYKSPANVKNGEEKEA